MAEIPIRRKEGRNVWPLLLGLIVLAAVLWFVVARHPTQSATAVRADTAAAANAGVRTDSAAGAVEKKAPDTSAAKKKAY